MEKQEPWNHLRTDGVDVARSYYRALSGRDTNALRSLTTDSGMVRAKAALAGASEVPDSLVAGRLKLRQVQATPTGGLLFFRYDVRGEFTTVVELTWDASRWRVANYPPLAEY